MTIFIHVAEKFTLIFCFLLRLKLSIPLIDGEFSKCTMYAVNYTQLLIDNVLEADPTWETQSCVHGFEFDHSEIPYTTIATEVNSSQ